LQAAKLLLNDVTVLYNELPICRGFSPEMLELAGQIKNSPDFYEKYRRVLGHLKKRLVATVKWCEKVRYRLCQCVGCIRIQEFSKEIILLVSTVCARTCMAVDTSSLQLIAHRQQKLTQPVV
jgi:phosphoenolpyruvate carboxylase